MKQGKRADLDPSAVVLSASVITCLYQGACRQSSSHSPDAALPMSSIQAMCMSRNYVAAVELSAAGGCCANKVNCHLPLPGRLRCPLQPYFQAPAASVALSGSVQHCCQKHGESQTLLQRWLWRTLGEDSSLPCLELHINTIHHTQ